MDGGHPQWSSLSVSLVRLGLVGVESESALVCVVRPGLVGVESEAARVRLW